MEDELVPSNVKTHSVPFKVAGGTALVIVLLNLLSVGTGLF
jgi:hypothetical protein